MQSNDQILLHRFCDLKERAKICNTLFASDFLNLAEQQILYTQKAFQKQFVFVGGYSLAERQLAVFGTDVIEDIVLQKWIIILKISPKSSKFAEDLTHRDFLGSILALGIKREMLGDILLSGQDAFLFAKPKVADFILDNLDRVRHTSVCVEKIDVLPKTAIKEPEESILISASARVDALLAAAFSLSRKDAQSLIDSGKVYANGKEILKSDFMVPENTIISARGYGRLKLLSLEGTTRKGRQRFKILKYT